MSPVPPTDPGAAARPTNIAIVGFGAVFPGASTLATATDEFWRLVESGRSAAAEPPTGRWTLPVDLAYDNERGAADRVNSRRGGFLSPQVWAELRETTRSLESRFEPGTWDRVDPIVFPLLHAGRAALERIPRERLDATRVGAVFGNIVLPTEGSSAWSRAGWGREFLRRTRSPVGLSAGVDPRRRFAAGLPAGILAHALDLGAGAYTLDAACASSLYSLRFAVDELRRGRADLMLAGGLSCPDPLYTQMGFSQLRAISPTGTCRPFDRRGNGLVVGEGAGLFALCRLEDALAESFPILGVIQGIGLSNDRRGSLLAPDTEGQGRALREAYREAGWSPHDIDLFECHATGTPVGDQVEVDSLSALLASDSRPSDRAFAPVVGSVKSNIGHLLTAAGAAGLTKVLTAIERATLPPTAGFEEPLDKLVASPLRALSRSEAWPDPGRPRRAAVSAFGFGGINAHVLIEEWRPTGSPATSRPRPIEVDATTEREGSEPIAIVGISVRTPHDPDAETFAARLLDPTGTAPAEPRPLDRYGAQGWDEHRELAGVAGHAFDALEMPVGRFRIPPSEMRDMLPQQALLLEAAADAFDEAGADAIDGERTGAFIGIGLDPNATNFTFRWWLHAHRDEQAALLESPVLDRATPPLSANRTMGALGGIVASRVARELRLGGPSFTVSSEECSGSRALELAVSQLREGRIDTAIAGAVDFGADPRAAIGSATIHPWARADETSRAFDPESTGARPGEGAVAFVLKRWSDAERDGDAIHAIICGVGSASGPPPAFAPKQPGRGDVDRDVDAQTTVTLLRAMERAQRDAGIDPTDVGYVESHGSGTPAEDRAEAGAIARHFPQRPRIGSAKDTVGHAGGAAGLIGLARAALALSHRRLPEGLVFTDGEAPLPRSTPVPAAHWLRDRRRGPRRAAVNAIGTEGSAHHVILEEAPASLHRSSSHVGGAVPTLHVWRAASPAALAATLRAARAQVRTDVRLASATTGNGPACAAIVTRSAASLVQELDRLIEHITAHPERPADPRDPRRAPLGSYRPQPITGEVAFVFPGSGNHFVGMARELALAWPHVLDAQDDATEELRSQWFPHVYWEATEPDPNDPIASLFGHVTVGVFVHDLLRSFGVKPESVIGYSLGETTSLFATRTWTARDEMLDRMRRTRLFRHELSGECLAARRALGREAAERFEWSLGVVPHPKARVDALLPRHPGTYRLIVNTPDECVIGGEREAVANLVADLGGSFHPLFGVTTVHCEVARSIADDYRALHLLETTPPSDVRIYSVARGEAHAVTRESAADSIVQQAVEGFDFPRTVRRAYDDGVRFFLEVGPGASASRMIERILADEAEIIWTRSACPKARDPQLAFLATLADLAVHGIPVVPPEVEISVPEKKTRYDTFTLPVGDDWSDLPSVGAPPPPRREERPVARPDRRPSTPEGPATTSSPSVPAPRRAPADAPTSTAIASGASPARESLTSGWGDLLHAESETARAHARFLELSQARTQTLAQWIEALARGEAGPAAAPPIDSEPTNTPTPSASPAAASPAPPGGASFTGTASTDATPVVFDREQCLELAIGSLAKVLGADFAEVDTFPTRVRLPDEPLMLVDRILELEGTPRSLGSGRVVTEHDVGARPWYLDSGRIPTSIAVESGQADLFLSGYLGIDHHTRGRAVYRLLDAEVTFHRDLPRAGEVIRYDIRIDHFFFQGETALFRFQFDATVDGELLLTMRNGCAGFFTQAELDAGQGIVRPRQQPSAPELDRPLADFAFLPQATESYDDAQVDALYRGDLAGCFGAAFAELAVAHPFTLPGGRLTLVHRVLSITPGGGRYGRGQIRAEMDIHPDDWFLTCHFSDDQVMPGTLMYECCLHTLRIYLLRLGWVGQADETWSQPVPGTRSRLKCRGQVIATTKKVVYEIDIKELGFGPEPYAITDALMYADGRPIVEIGDMSIQLRQSSEEKLRAAWSKPAGTGGTATPAVGLGAKRPAIYDDDRILAFAVGKPSEAFGEPYRVFDEERRIARLPGPPYKFLDRIVSIENGTPFVLEAGTRIEAQYDVPADEWYFTANRSKEMPFAVLLEIALQPCGWLAAYLGSALTSDIDLKFRNLGGSGTLHRAVTPSSETLTIAVTMTAVSKSGGMIIQHFDFGVSDAAGPVYDGKTYFGFFSAVALANQVGIRDAQLYSPTAVEAARRVDASYPHEAPFPEPMLRMIERVEFAVPDGGPEGLGFYQGTKDVDPSEWFFAAHFYQDPVCPGSLGLEAFLQLMKLAVRDRYGVDRPGDWRLRRSGTHEWIYRGQYVPSDSRVTVQAWVTAVDDDRREVTASGYLSVDGRTIYRMDGFQLGWNEERA